MRAKTTANRPVLTTSAAMAMATVVNRAQANNPPATTAPAKTTVLAPREVTANPVATAKAAARVALVRAKGKAQAANPTRCAPALTRWANVATATTGGAVAAVQAAVAKVVVAASTRCAPATAVSNKVVADLTPVRQATERWDGHNRPWHTPRPPTTPWPSGWLTKPLFAKKPLRVQALVWHALTRCGGAPAWPPCKA